MVCIGCRHKKVRRTCEWCAKSGHNHTPSGNTHRFHKTKQNPNPFCATHATTVRGRIYCKLNGTPKKRTISKERAKMEFVRRLREGQKSGKIKSYTTPTGKRLARKAEPKFDMRKRTRYVADPRYRKTWGKTDWQAYNYGDSGLLLTAKQYREFLARGPGRR